MSYDYGNQLEPGIVTNVESAETVSASGSAPADVGLVGQADLSNGTASANTVYEVTSAPLARQYFGDSSLLTDAVIDALNEGAFPVYAVAPSEETVSGEDLSGLSQNDGTLANGPVSEDPSDTTFTINSTTLTTVISYGDVASETPGQDEVLLNPVKKTFHIDDQISVGNASDSVDYSHYDYITANGALETDAASEIDFFVPLVEDQSVTDDVQTRVGNMASEYNFALGIVGTETVISDKASYTNPYDDSRMQVVYPTRNESGGSLLGSYAGLRASLGIQGTPINKRLSTQKDLIEKVPLNERGNLIENNVVPFAQEAAGARVADDVNTATTGNIKFGFSRLVVDFVLDILRESEEPFIGRLNSYPVRKSLEGLIRNQMKVLTRSEAIISFDVRVSKVDATTANLELNVDTAKPLRFIENTMTVGDSQ